jgi:flagellar motor switch protein FliM
MTPMLFDFRKPSPLASGLEGPLVAWWRAACALVTRKWAKQLPFPAELHFRGFEHLRTPDALSALPEPGVGYPLTLQETSATLLVWPRPLALAVIAGMMGDASDHLPEDREVTLVEEAVFEMFLRDYLLASFLETWRGVQPMKPVLGAKELFPRWARLFAPDDGVVIPTFIVNGPFGEHEFRWLFPLAGLRENFDPRGATPALSEAAVKPKLEALVKELPVRICVTLGSVDLPLAQIARLQPGDVIILNQRVSQPLPVWVEGEQKMLGWAGRTGTRQALQLEAFEK